MNKFDKIKLFCGKFRIVLGILLMIAGFFFTEEDQFYNIWFALGIVPLIAGLSGFCPLCLITKKCTI